MLYVGKGIEGEEIKASPHDDKTTMKSLSA